MPRFFRISLQYPGNTENWHDNNIVGSNCELKMRDQIIYVELKSGFSGNGPAWIGKARRSKSGRTIYFNDQAFQSMNGTGLEGNYRNIESGDEYWISGIKKDQQDRHWSGSGAIMIDESIVQEYLSIIGHSDLNPKKFKVIRFIKGDVIDRIQRLENKKIT